ncbi:DUF6113 family protein [Nocardioides lijunqiniae]|uniref:DUF6113 family protein n=1 Tax=Nocardioides lijunqiniae TaxID=2760832 RepID=UPI001878E137|nr:hypothetical protein [Nocardioides lijunqiniae]
MRALVALGLLVLGAATGLATVVLHSAWWGLMLGVAATAASLAALPPGWWARTAFGLAWAVTVGYFSVRLGEGDYLVSANLPGYLLLGGAMAVLVVSLATLPRPGRADAGKGPSAS